MPVNRDAVPSAWGSRRARAAQLASSQEAKSLGWEWARWGGQTYGTGIDYASEAGDLRLSSIVMACINWVTTNWDYITPYVERTTDGTTWARVLGHEATKLLDYGNAGYSGALLWNPLLLEYNIGGNAYIRKERNPQGRVIELWYEPAATIQARWDRDHWISHYEVWRDGRWYPRPVEDIIHIRNGIDPQNPRYGLSPLASALRQVYTDKGVENFNALLLRNLGMAGVIVSPGEPGGYWTQEQAMTVQALLQAKTAGDNRGLVTVLQQPMRLDYTSRTPADLQIQAMSDQPEERIPALLNIHPAVVGLGVGLEHSTYSNMEAAIRAAYRGNLMPTGQGFARELTQRLLPELGDPTRERIGFDYSLLPENEDKTTAATVATAAYDKGLATRNEGRRMIGLPPVADGDQFKAPAPAGFGGPMGDKGWDGIETKASAPPSRARLQAAFAAEVATYLSEANRRIVRQVIDG